MWSSGTGLPSCSRQWRRKSQPRLRAVRFGPSQRTARRSQRRSTGLAAAGTIRIRLTYLKNRTERRPLNTLSRRIALHGLILCALWPSILAAQTSLVSSALDGSVSDSSGGRIPGVRVTVRQLATHQRREVSTTADGTFRITELPPGT